MKNNIILIFTLVVFSLTSFCQTIPRFKKTEILNSGCSAYFPETPTNFEQTLSEDSSFVYTGSVDFDSYTYGIITIKFKTSFNGSSSEIEALLISYMDYLKTVFNVSQALGYGKGYTNSFNEKATGIIDTWEDKEKNTISVKAWIDNNYIGFLYIKGKVEYPNFSIKNIFLNGFIFGN
jgi:hypothetical protein